MQEWGGRGGRGGGEEELRMKRSDKENRCKRGKEKDDIE